MDISEALRTGVGVTMPEALSFGGLTTVVGMSIVFAVLLVLMIVLYLFKVIFYKDPDKAKKSAENIAVEPIVEAEQTETVDEGELIAVLTAAVAASLNTSTYNLNIKSYRRIESTRPIWNKEGLRETISNRY